jgi:hypothetical protein
MMWRDITWEVTMEADTVIIQGHRKFQKPMTTTQEKLLLPGLWELD